MCDLAVFVPCIKRPSLYMEIKSRDSGIDRQNLDSTDSLDGEFGYSQMLDSTLKRI